MSPNRAGDPVHLGSCSLGSSWFGLITEGWIYRCIARPVELMIVRFSVVLTYKQTI